MWITAPRPCRRQEAYSGCPRPAQAQRLTAGAGSAENISAMRGSLVADNAQESWQQALLPHTYHNISR
jgi:hypothetical protein